MMMSFALKPASGSCAGGGGASAAVKYLSSSKLLKLQLQDVGLRRHFLLQVLIFLHAVRHVGKVPMGAAVPALKDRQARKHTTRVPQQKLCRLSSVQGSG